jgi:hypothetical protein
MIDLLDHDYLVLCTSLLFPFGDGQVVSDLTATITLLSSVCTLLAIYHLTVLSCHALGLSCCGRAVIEAKKPKQFDDWTTYLLIPVLKYLIVVIKKELTKLWG